jgi:hypothetical protein
VSFATRREKVGKPSGSASVNRRAETADGPVGSLDTHIPPAGTCGGAGSVAAPVWFRHHTPVSRLLTAFAEGALNSQRLAAVPDRIANVSSRRNPFSHFTVA